MGEFSLSHSKRRVISLISLSKPWVNGVMCTEKHNLEYMNPFNDVILPIRTASSDTISGFQLVRFNSRLASMMSCASPLVWKWISRYLNFSSLLIVVIPFGGRKRWLPTLTTTVFSWFTFAFYASWYSRKMSSVFATSITLSTSTTVSSANNIAFSCYCAGFRAPCNNAFVAVKKIFAARLKRTGENGSPCCSPCWSGMLFVSSPLIIIQISRFLYILLI